jgi:hypothetical protein
MISYVMVYNAVSLVTLPCMCELLPTPSLAVYKINGGYFPKSTHIVELYLICGIDTVVVFVDIIRHPVFI